MTHTDDPRLRDLLRWLNPPRGGLWHGGATVLGTLRGVDAGTAHWKPAADRHSIWELTLHIAYWKYAVRRRFDGSERGGFARKPSDWPATPGTPGESAWKADRALLAEEHARLVAVVEMIDPGRLDEPSGKGTWTVMDLLSGVVLHDTYHVGQIQLMKRLHASQTN